MGLRNHDPEEAKLGQPREDVGADRLVTIDARRIDLFGDEAPDAVEEAIDLVDLGPARLGVRKEDRFSRGAGEQTLGERFVADPRRGRTRGGR